MSTSANEHRQLAKLWKDRHSHGEDTLQAQITYIRTLVESQAEDIPAGINDDGAYIHMSLAGSQSIAAAGEPIEWDSVDLALGVQGFADPTLPTTTLTVIKTGYYDIGIAAEWDTWEAGGAVWVVRTRSEVDLTVAPPDNDPGIWTATDGVRGSWVAKGIPLVNDDILTVYIDHNDGSAHTLAGATLTVEKVHGQGQGVAESSFFYYDVVLADSPLAYILFDSATGTQFDQSGNGYDWAKGGGGFADAPAVMVDGSERIAVNVSSAGAYEGGSDSAFDFTGEAPFSLELWINLDSGSATQSILYRRLPSGPHGYSIGVSSSDVLFWNRADGSSTQTQSGPTLATGTAYHVVATYDGASMRLYVDGALAAGPTATTISGMTASGGTLYIGEGFGGGDGYDGDLDEFAVYDFALSASQVANHYQVGTQGL